MQFHGVNFFKEYLQHLGQLGWSVKALGARRRTAAGRAPSPSGRRRTRSAWPRCTGSASARARGPQSSVGRAVSRARFTSALLASACDTHGHSPLSPGRVSGGIAWPHPATALLLIAARRARSSNPPPTRSGVGGRLRVRARR